MRYYLKIALILFVIVCGAISYLVLLERDGAARSLVFGVDRVGTAIRAGYLAYRDAKMEDVHRMLTLVASDERVIEAVKELKQDWRAESRMSVDSSEDIYHSREFFVSLIDRLLLDRFPKEQVEAFSIYLRDYNHKSTLLYNSSNSGIVGGHPSDDEKQLMEMSDASGFAQSFILSSHSVGICVAVPIFYEYKENGERELVGTLFAMVPIEWIVSSYSRLTKLSGAVVFTNAYADANSIALSSQSKSSTDDFVSHRVGAFMVTYASSVVFDRFIERGNFAKLHEGERADIFSIEEASYLATTIPIRDLSQREKQDVSSAGAVVFWQEADKEASIVGQDLMHHLCAAGVLGLAVGFVIFVVLWLAMGKMELERDESFVDLRRLAKELHDEVRVRQVAQEQLAEVRLQGKLAIKAKKDFDECVGSSLAKTLGELEQFGKSLCEHASGLVSDEGEKIQRISKLLEGTLLGALRITNVETDFQKKDSQEFSPILITKGLSDVLALKLIDCNVSLTINYDSSFPISMNGDVVNFEKLLFSLLMRAITISRGESVRLSISWSGGNKELTVKVQNRVLAVDAEKFNEQFLRLQSARNTLVKSLYGIEIELPYIIELTRLLDGSISYSMQKEVGDAIDSKMLTSEISVVLPIQEFSSELVESFA